MKRVEGNGFNIKSIASFGIRRISKLMWNENVGIIFLMIFGCICHKFRDIHPILENGCAFLTFLGFLSLVIVEGMNLASKWNKSGKRGFLTLGNIIGLVFLGILLAVGMYATFIIFYVKDFLTIDFLGIFGVIWTLRWIQKLKNFSSIRDDVHKLIGPLIAIVILISGYALHSKNTISGPFSCVLALATIWIFSLIFGDIKGRSNDQEDEINPFAIILSIILLGLVIYAIRNPEMYGIEIPSIDGRILKETYRSELKDSEEIGKIQARIDELEAKERQLSTEIASDAKAMEDFQANIDYLEETELPNADDELVVAKVMKAQLTTKEQELKPHKEHIESLDKISKDIQVQIKGKRSEINNMRKDSNIQTSEVEKLEKEIRDMRGQCTSIKNEINTYKTTNNLAALEEELGDADNLTKELEKADEGVKSATARYLEIRGMIVKIRDELLPEKKSSKDEKVLRLKELQEELKKEGDTLADLKEGVENTKNIRERLKEFSDAYSELEHAEKAAEQARQSAADTCKANLGLLKTERRALFS